MSACPRLARYFGRFSLFAGATVIVIAVVVLVGWTSGIAALTRPGPDWVAMNPLTAISFILCGVSLLLQRRAANGAALSDGLTRRPRLVGKLLAGAALVIAVACVLMYLLQGTGIDQVLFADQLNGNRMAPNTALCFITISLALLLMDWETRGGNRPAQVLALASASVAWLVLLGYCFNVRALYGVGTGIPMALPTAISHAPLSAGVLCGAAGSRIDGGDHVGQRRWDLVAAVVAGGDWDSAVVGPVLLVADAIGS